MEHDIVKKRMLGYFPRTSSQARLYRSLSHPVAHAIMCRVMLVPASSFYKCLCTGTESGEP